jgi:hypothetical protein
VGLVVVVVLETSLPVCAYVLAEANISHSGAMASIRVTILKEAVCSLLVGTDFMVPLADFLHL